MTSDKLEEHIDIHLDDINLVFSHHDNELVQSEVY